MLNKTKQSHTSLSEPLVQILSHICKSRITVCVIHRLSVWKKKNYTKTLFTAIYLKISLTCQKIIMRWQLAKIQCEVSSVNRINSCSGSNFTSKYNKKISKNNHEMATSEDPM